MRPGKRAGGRPKCYTSPDEGCLATRDKFCCPNCGLWKSRVVDSRPDPGSAERYLRWRHCAACHQLFETAEQLTGKTIAPRDLPEKT